MNSLPNKTIAIALMCILALGIYFWRCFFSTSPKEPFLNDGVIILLSCNGIMAGLSLAQLFFDPAFLKILPREIPALYILVGGIAVVWVSISSIFKTYQLGEERDSKLPQE